MVRCRKIQTHATFYFVYITRTRDLDWRWLSVGRELGTLEKILIDFMKTTTTTLALMGLLLMGAGCTTTTDVDVTGDTGSSDAEVAMEARMVDFHNNYNPSYDFDYDANMYTVHVAPAMLERPTQNDFMTVNDQEVYLKRNDNGELAWSMIWVNTDTADYATAEAEQSLSAGTDMTFGDIDARMYTDADGMTQYVILGGNGYYSVVEYEAGASAVTDSLTF